jgi:DNA topoisomerase-3
MKCNLVIAEKPSVAQTIAKVLGCNGRKDGFLEGNGWIVSWCVGHLVELAEPDVYDEKYATWKKEELPIFPTNWEYQVNLGTKKQFEILKDLMKRDDVSCVVNACDAGREGELIFRLVYEKAGCKKPMKRLWTSSLEDEAIRKGFDDLADGKEYDRLYEAALCRERADWIVGINATRFFSTVYGQTLNVGRVMTPTLALAVEREAQIRAFKSEDTFAVMIETPSGIFSSQKFKDEGKAKETLKNCLTSRFVKITKLEKKERQEKAPALFDLTSLQREANRKLGYTAQQTLDYVQALYEKKLTSYPRTDSRYLTEDMEESLPSLIMKATKITGLQATKVQNLHAVINGKKVTDHHAIIPTMSSDEAVLSELPKGEQEILRLIANRLLEAISSPCTYAEAVVEAECQGETFSAKGKTVLSPGWKGVAREAEKTADEKDEGRLNLTGGEKEGAELSVLGGSIKAGKTTPPKSYTEDTLLSAMEKAGSDETPEEAERKGLGTPATRAGIIEKLVRIGFIERRGDGKTKFLVPTHKGESLITVIPEEIQSASMTAEWEQKLLKVEHDQYESGRFMGEIEEMIRRLIETYEIIPDAEVLMRPAYEPMGKCPRCGSDVVEKSKGFFCGNRDCRFALWKENRFFNSLSKKLTKQIAEQLLSTGRAKLKKCRSLKTGKTFDAAVVLSHKDDGQAVFTLEFDKGGK